MRKVLLLCAVILLLTGCMPPKPAITIPDEQPSASQLATHPHVVVVLGSGGVRGLAHVGVLKALARHHVPVDMVVGTSSGSIVGALYADRADINQAEQTLLSSTRSDMMHVSLVGLRLGLVSGYRMQNFLLHHMQARQFSEMKTKFVAVATDIHTGRTVYLDAGPIAPAVNASSAVPIVFRPVTMYHHRLVDGGLSAPVAVPYARRFHPDLVIAVNISEDLPYVLPRGLFDRSFRSFVVMSRHYATHLSEQADIVLYPDVGTSGMFNSVNKRRMVRAGERVAERAMPKILAALKARKVALVGASA